MTPKENAFINEYMLDRNGTRSAIAAGYAPISAAVTAHRLITNDKIADEIARREAVIAAKAELKVEDVMRNVRQVMNADPRELIEHRRCSCRYCHGVMFMYQFTPQEYRDAYIRHIASDDYTKRGIPFNTQGGDGYNPRLDPNPDCPECFGDGVTRTIVKDTRDLSPEAAALYAGVKQTAGGGLEVIMQSKEKAREQAAKYLGMNKETLQVTTAPSGLDHFYGATSKPIDGNP